MGLLYSSTFQFLAYKVRYFDTSIRVQTATVEVCISGIECILPTVKYHDNVIYYMRMLEGINDPFESSKDDAASFFAINEEKSELIESTYISSNLRIITPFSEALNRPVSKFDTVKGISETNVSPSGTDEYVALNFEEIEDYSNLEICRKGIACIICGCKATPSNMSYDMFSTIADENNLKYVGHLPDINLTQNFGTTEYCSFYYGVFYSAVDDATFYLSFKAASVGYIFIDDVLFLSQETLNSTTAVTGIATLKMGYHTIIIKQYATAASTVDFVRLQFKMLSGDSYVDFNVDNLTAKSSTLLSFPIYDYDVEKNPEAFSEIPIYLKDPSLDSLFIQRYRPLLVLARKYGSLLQKEFGRMYYTRIPDNVTSSALTQGTLSSIYAPYNFPLAANGITLNCDRTIVLSPFITYTYYTPVKISQFELCDVQLYGSSASDWKQCWSFTFSIVNQNNERVRYSDLKELIDLDASRNVEMLQAVNNSDTYVRVVKLNYSGSTLIVFKDYVTIKELTLRDPSVPGTEWGTITSLRVHLKATEIVKIMDKKGDMRIIQNLEDDNLVPIDYDGIGYIPTLFDHKNITPDVQYGAEFIMYCLDVHGSIDPVVTLGNVYSVKNTDDHVIFNSDHLLNIRQLSQTDDRKFSIHSDRDQSEQYDFAYVGYSTAQNVALQTDYSTIIVTLTNTSGSALTDNLFDIKISNTGNSYQCVDQSLNVIPVAAVRSNNTLTNDALVWDTQTVRVKVPSVLANSSISLTFTFGSFSNPSLLTGTTATTYRYLSDLQQLPIVVVRIPMIAESQSSDIAVLSENTIPVASNIVFDVPEVLTIASVIISELTGTDRNDVEITVDVSDLLGSFTSSMFLVYDAITRQPLDTVGINNDNSVTAYLSDWTGYRIRFRIPLLKGGVSSYFLIRVGKFQGDPSTFTPSVQNNVRHNLHFSGSLVDSVTGTIGIDNGVVYGSDKTLEYYRAAHFENKNVTTYKYARIAATTNTTNFSVSFWFYTDSQTGILCFSNTATLPSTVHDLRFGIDSNGFLVCTISSGSGDILIASDRRYDDSQWHHAVLTSSNASGMSLYVDLEVKDTGLVMARTITTAYVYLGWSSTYFTGAIDEFRVYNKVLTLAEVKALNLLFDGTITETSQQYQQTNLVHSPVGRITNLVDTSALLGDPVYIYKYINIDETIVRFM